MAKKVRGFIKLQVPAGQANPSPPIGPALGQHGVNIMEFCKAFNAHSQGMELGVPVPVELTVYQDRSFSFITQTPPASYCLKKAAGLHKAGPAPGGHPVGQGRRATGRGVARPVRWSSRRTRSVTHAVPARAPGGPGPGAAWGAAPAGGGTRTRAGLGGPSRPRTLRRTPGPAPWAPRRAAR